MSIPSPFKCCSCPEDPTGVEEPDIYLEFCTCTTGQSISFESVEKEVQMCGMVNPDLDDVPALYWKEGYRLNGFYEDKVAFEYERRGDYGNCYTNLTPACWFNIGDQPDARDKDFYLSMSQDFTGGSISGGIGYPCLSVPITTPFTGTKTNTFASAIRPDGGSCGSSNYTTTYETEGSATPEGNESCDIACSSDQWSSTAGVKFEWQNPVDMEWSDTYNAWRGSIDFVEKSTKDCFDPPEPDTVIGGGTVTFTAQDENYTTPVGVGDPLVKFDPDSEDKEDAAIAETPANQYGITISRSIYEQRTVGAGSSVFKHITSKYTIKADRLTKGAYYSGCVRIKRRRAYAGVVPEGADLSWEEISSDPIPVKKITSHGEVTLVTRAMPFNRGYEYAVIQYYIWRTNSGATCNCPTEIGSDTDTSIEEESEQDREPEETP